MRVLIIGATSAIAEHCARLWAGRNATLFLVGRNDEKLEFVAADLRVRGAESVTTYIMDADTISAYEPMLQAAVAGLTQIDVALVAFGVLPDQSECEQNPTLSAQHFTTNATSTIALLTALAKCMKAQKSGTIAVISSVAGDRGRASNYHYGAAKGAISIFAQGMRASLAATGVHVLTIKPGFVATPMTKHLSLPTALVAEPSRVARDIVRAIDQRKMTIYTPPFWRYIMLIIKAIPERIFMRLKL